MIQLLEELVSGCIPYFLQFEVLLRSIPPNLKRCECAWQPSFHAIGNLVCQCSSFSEGRVGYGKTVFLDDHIPLFSEVFSILFLNVSFFQPFLYL